MKEFILDEIIQLFPEEVALVISLFIFAKRTYNGIYLKYITTCRYWIDGEYTVTLVTIISMVFFIFLAKIDCTSTVSSLIARIIVKDESLILILTFTFKYGISVFGGFVSSRLIWHLFKMQYLEKSRW